MLCFRCGSYNSDDALNCTVCGQDLAEGQKKAPTTGQHAVMIFAPGELVAGRYKIIEQLGAGGVGAVYRARDTEVDVDIAIKGISANLVQTEEEQKTFSKAIKAARKLQHQNIVRIYDEGHHQQPNRRFFTMKLLEGLTLRKIIRLRHDKGQAFSPEEIVPIFHQLAAALDYAHKQTWHGDLKPENIIVLPDLLKITDFALVKGLPLKPFLGIAKSRSKGFPYIAPELRVEAQSIDGRVDIYSMGVILGEMLTGIVYEGHFSRAFTAALEQLPTRLDGLIRRALAEHPDGRFAKASEMVKEVESALNAMGGTPLPPPVPTPKEAFSALSPRPAAPIARTLPPPPPQETNPSQVAAGRRKNIEDDESLMELGASQILMLESQVIRRDDPSNIDDSSISNSGISSSGLDDNSSLSTEDSLLARRLANLGSNPDDTVDDPTMRGGADDIDTNPGARLQRLAKRPSFSSGERPPRPDELLESLYADENDDKLIPPPLPDDDDAPLGDESYDARFPLPGDEELPTVENRMIAGGRAPVPQASSHSASDVGDSSIDLDESLSILSESQLSDSQFGDSQLDGLAVDESQIDSQDSTVDGRAMSAADALGLTSDEPSVIDSSLASLSSSLSSSMGSDSMPPPIPPADAGLEIHDALTALKLHPRPDLVEDAALREALTRTAGTATNQSQLEPPALPPEPYDDADDEEHEVDDSMSETVTQAGRPSTPSAGVAGGFGARILDDMGPPSLPLRPVSPPRRPANKQGLHPAGIVAGVSIAVLVLLLGGMQVRKRFANTVIPDDGGDTVTVTTPTTHPDPTRADAGVLDTAADAGVVVASVPTPNITAPVVDAAAEAEERAAAELRAREEMEKREREAAALAAATPTTPEPLKVEPPKEDPKVAMAEAGTCPAGMAKIDGGSLTFGSSGSDPMRNFGELDAKAVDVKAYCIDYYEAPNGAKALPTTGVSWTAAKNTCDRSGKRLCSEAEWERACKGPGSSRFPYGNTYDADACNTEDADAKARPLARPVDFKKCRSGFKVYMLAGNAEEWTADAVGGQRVAKGGSSDRPDFASRCSARRPLSPKTASGMLGFRCCADPG